MLLLTLFITVLLTFTSGQTVGSEIDQKELVLIKDYKAFFLNTCERLEKNVTVPNYLKGWQEKFQNKKGEYLSDCRRESHFSIEFRSGICFVHGEIAGARLLPLQISPRLRRRTPSASPRRRPPRSREATSYPDGQRRPTPERPDGPCTSLQSLGSSRGRARIRVARRR